MLASVNAEPPKPPRSIFTTRCDAAPNTWATRAAATLQYVTGNTSAGWAQRVLLDIKAVARRGGARTYMGYGLGLGYRLMGFGSSFKPLNPEQLVASYRRAGRRLIVCDYGGTLNVRDNNASRKHAYELGLLGRDAAPPLTTEVRRALKALSEDARNTVFVISGKEKDVLQQAFAALPYVGIGAEHGYCYRWGASRTPRGAAAAAAAADATMEAKLASFRGTPVIIVPSAVTSLISHFCMISCLLMPK